MGIEKSSHSTKLSPEGQLVKCALQQNALPLKLTDSAAINLGLEVLGMASFLRRLDLSHDGLQALLRDYQHAQHGCNAPLPAEPRKAEPLRKAVSA